jgi:hypothetical protein
MCKKLAVSVVAGLLLGAPSVAMAQQTFWVVTSYQATADVAAQVPLAVGSTFCIDALGFLTNAGLVLRGMHVEGNSLIFVVMAGTRGSGSGAIVLCAPAA